MTQTHELCSYELEQLVPMRCFGLPSKCTKQGFSISRLHLESRKDMWSSGRVVQWDATHQGWTLVSHLFSRFLFQKKQGTFTCVCLVHYYRNRHHCYILRNRQWYCRFLAKTGSDRTNRHWYSGLHCRFISLLVLAKKRQWYWVITAGFSQEPTLILSLSAHGLNHR